MLTNLSGGTPAGGTYSGPGVIDNGDGTYDFNPAMAGAGTHTITYTIAEGFNQIGANIDGEAALDQSGWSVSLSSSGDVVAIGAPANDETATSAGHAL